MSKLLGLRTAIYKVADLAAAKAWYSKAFGTEPYFDEPFYVGFDIAGYELGLLPEEDNTSEKGESVFTYWGVEDIAKQYTHLQELGATAHEEPTDVGEGVMVAAVKDPWDNILGIIYNPYFKVKE